MANALYGKGRQAFLDGDIDWAADTIKCVLIDTASYTVDINVDEFFDDIPGAAIIGSEQTLAGKSSTLGVADANDISFAALVAAPTIEALVIFKDTGVDATSRLIAYIDTATGLPVSAGATQVDVQWDAGANKIFKL